MSGHHPQAPLASGDKAGQAAALGRIFFSGLASSWGKWASRHYKDFREESAAQDSKCKDFTRGCSEEEAMPERLGIPLAH